jgi:hypothetical protein
MLEAIKFVQVGLWWVRFFDPIMPRSHRELVLIIPKNERLSKKNLIV